jgi:hypothetical protein
MLVEFSDLLQEPIAIARMQRTRGGEHGCQFIASALRQLMKSTGPAGLVCLID